MPPRTPRTPTRKDKPVDDQSAQTDERKRWVVVKTSGGYGVLKSASGERVRKPFLVRPDGSDETQR